MTLKRDVAESDFVIHVLFCRNVLLSLNRWVASIGVLMSIQGECLMGHVDGMWRAVTENGE